MRFFSRLTATLLIIIPSTCFTNLKTHQSTFVRRYLKTSNIVNDLETSALPRRKLLTFFTFLISTSLAPSVESITDEFDVTLDGANIGIELMYISYGKNGRIGIRRILEDSPASREPRLRERLLLVSVNGFNLEQSTVKQAVDKIRSSPRPITLRLRNPSIFSESLSDSEMLNEGISTRIAQDENDSQILSVQTVSRSDVCLTCSGAKRGDLLEIQYSVKVVGNAQTLDSTEREKFGRGGDSTFYFVVGAQPKGQFPPGWDLGMVGMCPGEIREITVPKSLAYGKRGMPSKGIPPNATLAYTVKLISINSIFMCDL